MISCPSSLITVLMINTSYSISMTSLHSPADGKLHAVTPFNYSQHYCLNSSTFCIQSYIFFFLWIQNLFGQVQRVQRKDGGLFKCRLASLTWGTTIVQC